MLQSIAFHAGTIAPSARAGQARGCPGRQARQCFVGPLDSLPRFCFSSPRHSRSHLTVSPSAKPHSTLAKPNASRSRQRNRSPWSSSRPTGKRCGQSGAALEEVWAKSTGPREALRRSCRNDSEPRPPTHPWIHLAPAPRITTSESKATTASAACDLPISRQKSKARLTRVLPMATKQTCPTNPRDIPSHCHPV